jgi:hypothetical protein
VEVGQQKQAFSIAYARAVAAVAGFTVSVPETDDDSIDLGFASGSGLIKRPRIEAQMKCSADDELRPSDFSFPLSLKNYDDLRADALVPRILVVVRVPPNPDEWLAMSEEQLCLSYCAYWHSLFGEPESLNSSGVSVRISRAQMFGPGELTAMMARVQAGSRP